ncbi:MAG: biotin/lipoyl-containing protein [Actinomycetota bacterium]
MSRVRNCDIPDDLYYVVEKHIWARYDGELVTVGMTDVAQHLAHTFLSVTAKDPGRTVKKAKSIATVESSKWVGPVPSPVEGEIAEINAAVVAQPTTINRDPYGDGWIARLRPTDWITDSADLATGAAGVAAYEAFLVAEGIECGEG